MLLDLWNQLHRVELNGGSEFASSLMSGAPETVQALEEWCDAHPESELTMRGIECTWCSSAKCENVTSYTHESNTHSNTNTQTPTLKHQLKHQIGTMYWALGGRHDFDDFLRTLCFSKGSDVSALPPPIPTKKSSEGGRWYDRKHVKLAQKHLRPAKELATPPPQQRKNELKKKR